MKVTANGKPVRLPQGATVSDLVAVLGLGMRWVVVEHNGEPVSRDKFESQVLADGDRLEVVRPVQGGSGLPAARRTGAPAIAAARLYLVCDEEFTALGEVVAAGVDIVQLRAKDASDRRILGAAARLGALGVPLIINDRPDLALAAGADGVHLGQDDVEPWVARRILGPDAIIGLSTHSREQVDAAEVTDVDYIAVGPVFATPTKPGRPAVGTGLVAYAASRVSRPWFAIGGIDASNAGAVLDAGASRIAVVRAITRAAVPAEAAAILASKLKARRDAP